MPNQQELINELRARQLAWSKVAPRKRANYGVLLGSRDRSGMFTTVAEGDSNPDPSSVAALAERHGDFDPVHRLVWFLRHTDTLCIDGTTARIIARGELDALVSTIRDARLRGLAVRFNDHGTEAVEVDPVAHRDHVIGLRLTEKGQSVARALEQRYDANLPVETLAL